MNTVTGVPFFISDNTSFDPFFLFDDLNTTTSSYNDLNTSTDISIFTKDSDRDLWRDIPLGCLLTLLSILTFVGNAMVLHAVRTERRLQTVSSMPYFVLRKLMQYQLR